MDRRTYLGAVASILGLGGGCLGGKAEPPAGESTGAATPTPTITDTRTASPSATDTESPTTETEVTETETEPPETEESVPARPVIEQANLLWSDHGDDPVRRHAVESTGVGASIRLGARTRVSLDPSGFEARIDARIFDRDGSQIDTLSDTLEVTVDEPRVATVPIWAVLDTTGYTRGRFSAEVTVTDLVREVTSEPATVEFEIVEPLSRSEVELRTYEPRRVTTNEPVGWALTFRNLSDRTSSVNGTLLVELEEDGSQRLVSPASWTIPARSTVTLHHDDITFNTPDTYVFKLQPHDITWQIEAVDSDESARLGRTV